MPSVQVLFVEGQKMKDVIIVFLALLCLYSTISLYRSDHALESLRIEMDAKKDHSVGALITEVPLPRIYDVAEMDAFCHQYDKLWIEQPVLDSNNQRIEEEK